MGAKAQTSRSLPQYGKKTWRRQFEMALANAQVSFPAHRKIFVAETQACRPSGVQNRRRVAVLIVQTVCLSFI